MITANTPSGLTKTYNVLLSGYISKIEFERIIFNINNNTYVKKWLMRLYKLKHGYSGVIGLALFVTTIIGGLVWWAVDDAKGKKIEKSMKMAMTKLIENANMMTPNCSWTFVYT